MAELPSSNISIDDAVGVLGGDSDLVSLGSSNSINKWSFYRPRPITLDANKRVILGAPYSGKKLGNFRRYDHTANTPYVVTTANKTYVEGYSTFNNEIDVRTERLNVVELLNLTTPYLQTDYYSSSANRAARTNRRGYERVLLDLYTEVPPVGHSNNQTLAPDSGAQVIEFPVNVAWLSSTPNGSLYCETYICDSNGNPLIYFDAGGYTTVSVTRLNLPRISNAPPVFTYPALGYDAVALILMEGSTALTDVNSHLTMTVNTDNASFYFALVGFNATTSKAYRLGATSFSGRMSIGSKTYSLGINSLAYGSNTYANTSNMFGTNDLWKYNDVAHLEFISASGITVGGEVDITNTPW